MRRSWSFGFLCMQVICPIGIFFSRVCVCVCVHIVHAHACMCTCHRTRVKVRGKLPGVSSFLLPCEPLGLNSGRWIWQQERLPAKPSHQPYLVLLFLLETSKKDSQKDKACDPKPQHIEGKQWSGSRSLSSPLLCAWGEKRSQWEMKWAVWWNVFSQGNSPSVTGTWSMASLKMRSRQNWSILTPDSQVRVKKDTRKHRWQSMGDSSSPLCPLVKAGLN